MVVREYCCELSVSYPYYWNKGIETSGEWNFFGVQEKMADVMIDVVSLRHIRCSKVAR